MRLAVGQNVVIDYVPNKKHKSGEMAPVYMSPKRNQGAERSGCDLVGDIPQVPETYAYINAAYPIMNERQLAIGETTFGGKIGTEE